MLARDSFCQIKIELNVGFSYDPPQENSQNPPPPSAGPTMLEFDVQRFSRCCTETDRELEPGEPFYSALVPVEAEVVRKDYCAEAWNGPPDDAIGWWQSEVPDPKSKKVHWAPSDVMLHYFLQLADQKGSEDTRYILALLMIRKRILRLDETDHDDNGCERLHVYCSKNESEYEIPVVNPSSDRIDVIQAELAKLLFK